MRASSFPLQWPDHIPRSGKHESSRFRTEFPRVMDNVVKALKAFGSDSGKAVSDAVISSNMELLNSRPDDPGVAVWFSWDGISVCIPVDRYRTPAENLNAIYHVIEARRTELRHGTLHLVRATFQGFKALPAPPGEKRKPYWWEVLGVTQGATLTEIESAYREKAKTAHPDVGGSQRAMAYLNKAREEGKAANG